MGSLSSSSPNNASWLELAALSDCLDVCIAAVVACASTGVEGLQNTHLYALYNCLQAILKFPERDEKRIRAVPEALAFCLENSVEICHELGMSTGSAAAQICEPPHPLAAREHSYKAL